MVWRHRASFTIVHIVSIAVLVNIHTKKGTISVGTISVGTFSVGTISVGMFSVGTISVGMIWMGDLSTEIVLTEIVTIFCEC